MLFAVYLASLVASGIFFGLRCFTKVSDSSIFMADLFVSVCQFAVELCLCFIFLSLIDMKFEANEDSYEPIHVESFTSEEEFHRRIWNQFMQLQHRGTGRRTSGHITSSEINTDLRQTDLTKKNHLSLPASQQKTQQSFYSIEADTELANNEEQTLTYE
jgi:hydroxyacyl-ACP dehydratase HTD2-like protein with hotdog domain